MSDLDQSPHLGNIWENFVFTEFIKEGFIAGKNVFFIRDQNKTEIDFVIEKDGKVFLIEAKTSERPNPKKLNFNKIAPLFKKEVVPVVACTVEEPGVISLKDYSVYNPLYGFLFSHF
jgi:predicted AAA+ superfamily ATPase